jgi:hypothetical protein
MQRRTCDEGSFFHDGGVSTRGRTLAEKPHTRHFAQLLRPGEGNAKDASKSDYHGARGLLEVHGNPSFLSNLQQTLGRAAERFSVSGVSTKVWRKPEAVLLSAQRYR